MKSRLPRVLAPFRQDLRLWLLVMLLLSAFRVLQIVVFHDRMAADSGAGDILQVVLYGMRFDCMVAGYVVALPLLLGMLGGLLPTRGLAYWSRLVLGVVFLVCALWVFIVALDFFHEFDSPFNHFIFIGMQDDTDAILQTVWKEYHPIRSLLIFIALFVPLLRLLRPLRRRPRQEVAAEGAGPGRVTVLAVDLLVLALLFLSLRGSVGRRPAQRVDAAVSTDLFLNKTVLNPFVALNYAFKDHARLNSAAGLGVFLPDHDLQAALARTFPEASPSADLDDYFRRVAKGVGSARRPRHVFMLMMESYDSWPMMPEYAALRLTEGLQGLAAEGLHCADFLSSAPGTMASVAGVLTGLPDAGLQTDLQPQTRSAYPTALAATFRRLGYRTRFFYGGKLGWRNIDAFAAAQGFEEIYGGSSMGAWQDANEWGVDDEYLFDFVADSLSDEVPTFNFILSTSYHPPYDIDVRAAGYPVHRMPSDLVDLYDGTFDLGIWGHLWYADKVMTAFIRAAAATLPDTLFAVTGDHYARKFLNATPSLYERSSVPFVLFGPEVLQGRTIPADNAGSHVDIAPTLVELAAPAGFRYHAFGRDLLDPRQVGRGYGRETVIGADFIAQLRPDFILEALPGRPLPEPPPSEAELRRFYDDVHGIAWWRIRNGASIRPPGR
jgi:phosphoglycerol transferase MdoB-like AlkP superfamily enzyme